MSGTIKCYVCGERVPKASTSVGRHRVPSGAVNTRSAFTYRMVRKCHPYCGWSATVNGQIESSLTSILHKELRRVAAKLSNATEERDELILRAYREGASLREIATLLNVNHVTVRNILIKRTGKDPGDIR